MVIVPTNVVLVEDIRGQHYMPVYMELALILFLQLLIQSGFHGMDFSLLTCEYVYR